MNLKAKLVFPINEIIKECGLNEGGKVQKYIDQFVLYKSSPYVPARHVQQSGIIATKIGSGKVIWDSPDANYLYEGKLMVDPYTLKGAFFNPNYGYWSRPHTEKIMDPQGRNLNYHSGGKKDNHWFDRMISNNMDELVQGIEKIIGGNNGK